MGEYNVKPVLEQLNPLQNNAYNIDAPTPAQPPPDPVYLPITKIQPIWYGGTVAVSTSTDLVFQQYLQNGFGLHSISIAPLTSGITVTLFIKYGSQGIWQIGYPLTSSSSTFSISGTTFTRDWKGTNRNYPVLKTGDVIEVHAVSTGSGSITIDIDGEYIAGI